MAARQNLPNVVEQFLESILSQVRIEDPPTLTDVKKISEYLVTSQVQLKRL